MVSHTDIAVIVAIFYIFCVIFFLPIYICKANIKDRRRLKKNENARIRYAKASLEDKKKLSKHRLKKV